MSEAKEGGEGEAKDPLLAAQEKTRGALNQVLGKHGWKLIRVGLRARFYVVYTLCRLDGAKKIEHVILLNDVMAWALRAPVPTTETAGLDTDGMLLGIALLLRVKQENRSDGYAPTVAT